MAYITLMSAQKSVQNKTGKNVGLRGIWFNGKRKHPQTGEPTEYVKERYIRYVVQDFSRLATAHT